jgi:putative ATP-dependent endonuclease of the OLD family
VTDQEQPETASPVIRKLTIERFRGIQRLEWWPAKGVNLILGGGDVGKSTILDAIALILSPTNSATLSEADYWRRKVEDGFRIEAVMSLHEGSGIAQQAKNMWPWEWDGKDAKLPIVDDGPGKVEAVDPVYCVQVCGTPDFDLIFEVIQPDGTTDHFSAAVRRKIGMVRLSGDDRNDRDLRLVQGSGLDRLLSHKTLRARLQQKLSVTDIEDALTDDGKQALADLNTLFKEQALPDGLGLGLISGQGASLNALVGLMATKDAVKLPLATWGAGTRRLAALEIAAAHHGNNPITLVDEVERGLEPYRQRGLIRQLQEGKSQVFLTTHSATALSAGSASSIWYIDAAGGIGELHADVAYHLENDPEAFLSRATIFCEGPAEMGFVEELLRRAIDDDLLAHGVWIADGNGNEHTLKALCALVGSGLKFAGFADDEGTFPGKWKTVQGQLGGLLFRWPHGCLEENLIALVPDAQLEDFITDPEDDFTGERRRTMADRLQIHDSDFASLRANAADFRKLIVEAATGFVPENRKDEKKVLKKHSQRWFKSVAGGHELADKVFKFGLWAKLEKQLLPFLNAVRASVSLPPLEALSNEGASAVVTVTEPLSPTAELA